MLTLRVTPYASTEWRWDGTSYTTNDHTSQITPYAHPMVEQLAITDGQRTALVVRERVADRAPVPPQVRTVTPDVFDQAVALARRPSTTC